MSPVKFINKVIQIYFSARTLSIERRALLLNLSLVVEFLRNVFTNSIFEKILSHEALVTGRATAISNNLYKQSNAPLWGAINEINCSSDVGSCDSFRSNFFASSVSCFKWFSLIEYAFANFFKCPSDINVWPRDQTLYIFDFQRNFWPDFYCLVPQHQHVLTWFRTCFW